MRKRVFKHIRTAEVQISLRIRAVWSGLSVPAFEIIWHYRMYQWKANACWAESAHFAHVRRHLFAWQGPIINCLPEQFDSIFYSVFVNHTVQHDSVSYLLQKTARLLTVLLGSHIQWFHMCNPYNAGVCACMRAHACVRAWVCVTWSIRIVNYNKTYIIPYRLPLL